MLVGPREHCTSLRACVYFVFKVLRPFNTVGGNLEPCHSPEFPPRLLNRVVCNDFIATSAFSPIRTWSGIRNLIPWENRHSTQLPYRVFERSELTECRRMTFVFDNKLQHLSLDAQLPTRKLEITNCDFQFPNGASQLPLTCIAFNIPCETQLYPQVLVVGESSELLQSRGNHLGDLLIRPFRILQK